MAYNVHELFGYYLTKSKTRVSTHYKNLVAAITTREQ